MHDNGGYLHAIQHRVLIVDRMFTVSAGGGWKENFGICRIPTDYPQKQENGTQSLLRNSQGAQLNSSFFYRKGGSVREASQHRTPTLAGRDVGERVGY